MAVLPCTSLYREGLLPGTNVAFAGWLHGFMGRRDC